MTLPDVVRNPNALIGVSAGMYDGLSVVHKFGYNGDIDNGSTPETIWSGGGQYSFDISGTVSVVSTSSSDTSNLKVYGLDSDFNEVTETVTLTGTTAVNLSNTYKRIYRMQYNATNVGTITADVGATTYAQIEVGESQTLMAVYTVPKGKTAFLLGLNLSVNKGHDAQVKMYVRESGGAFQIKHVAEVYESQYTVKFDAPMKFTEKTDIEFRVTSVESSGTKVSCNFDLLVDSCLNY